MKRPQKPSADRTDAYDDFVTHPRFGQGPRLTGSNPAETWDYGQFYVQGPRFVMYGWHQQGRIPGTAVAADCSKQKFVAMGVTHYFDRSKSCQDCKRPFIFFAEEQKHWYEELGFSLDADCVRCVPCRKREQGVAGRLHRYEELFHIPERTADESLEMAECCMALIEGQQFGRRQTERVRMLLKAAAGLRSKAGKSLRDQLLARVEKAESEASQAQSTVKRP